MQRQQAALMPITVMILLIASITVFRQWFFSAEALYSSAEAQSCHCDIFGNALCNVLFGEATSPSPETLGLTLAQKIQHSIKRFFTSRILLITKITCTGLIRAFTLVLVRRGWPLLGYAPEQLGYWQ